MKTTLSVTTSRYTPGAVDDVAFADFVKKSIKSNLRARDKAAARGLSRSVWFGKTDAECEEAARSYCGCYRHQFRVLVPIAD